MSGDAVLGDDFTILGRVPTASNVVVVGEYPSGERCIYKPVRGEAPLWDFPDGTLAGREVAAYLVSRALGWNLIPETVLADGPLGPGMVQRFVEAAHSTDPDRADLVELFPTDEVPREGWMPILEAYDTDGAEIVLAHADDPRLQRMAVLDVVLNNADRKGGHVIEGTDGEVYAIDHGICLHADPKLRTVLWGWAGTEVPAHLVADVATLPRLVGGELGDALAPHLTRAEIDALAQRASALAATPLMPTPPPSRPIPWPPF